MTLEHASERRREILHGAARALALCAGVWLLGCGAAAAGEPVQDSAVSWIGREAPEIRLKTIDGTEVALADYRGKIVVLHFGASW